MDSNVIIAICLPIVLLVTAVVMIRRDRRKGRDPFDGSSNNNTMDNTGI